MDEVIQFSMIVYVICKGPATHLVDTQSKNFNFHQMCLERTTKKSPRLTFQLQKIAKSVSTDTSGG